MNAAPEIISFGCRLNIHESEVMRDHATAAGLQNTVIFNTCAVTTEAERQARQAIRKLRRERPDAQIIVTGCAAQVNPDAFAKMPEVNQIIGNDLKLKRDTWTRPQTERVIVNDIMSVTETAGHLVKGFTGKSRAFVQVQNGCDHRCTFCIIPYGRGNSRSVPIGEIVMQVRDLVAAGFQEVVLTGVDVTSYGPDLPGAPKLGQMIRRLLAMVPELPRLRLSSLDPVEIDDDLWRLIENEPRLMPHLHLSLQAGDDMVLKRMKRRHLRQDAIDMCQRARAARPDMVFGADIIAGFPTETDEMHLRNLDIIDECDLTWLHVFPYSPRPMTPAAKMPQVAPQIRKQRAAEIRVRGKAQVQKFLASQIGKTLEVLVEQDGLSGHTPQFAPVKFDSAQVPGTLVKTYITSHTNKCLVAV